MEKRARKTKVLLVITKSNFGGAQKYVYDLALNAPREHFEVVVALGGNGVLISMLEQADIRTIPLTTLGRDVRAGADFKSFFELLRVVLREKPDVLHLNSSKVGVMGGIVGRIARVPRVIFTAHGWAFNENRSLPARLAIKTLSWITVLLSHKTIAVSQAIVDTLPWPGVRGKTVVIHHGIGHIDPLPQSKARTQLETLGEFKLSRNAFVFGTIAELHPSKGLIYAIKAFKEIADVHPHTSYLIIGGGQDHEKLQNLIQEEGLAGRVHLLGFMSQAARYLQAFDCFVLPSTTEALGYVILEAGSAGLPVIASRVGGIPEILNDMQNGLLVEPRKPEYIAQAMELLFTDEALRAKIAKNLKGRIEQDFSLAQSIKKTISLYTRGS